MAAEIGQLELLHILWYWAKDTLTVEELNNMFLSKMKKKDSLALGSREV